MQEHSRFIEVVVSIASDMVASLNNQTRFVQLRCKALGQDGAGKARTHDEEIEFLHENFG